MASVARGYILMFRFRVLNAPTPFPFFTGKGGVGKTSLACATAMGLADRGLRVLIVSTDPASNLDEMLEVALTDQPNAGSEFDRTFGNDH
jgi:arsenite-transporting ATPase